MTYVNSFFTQYNPITARDMVEQVPGFQISEGGDLRGFGGTAGNILINGQRPSTKNDDASAILGRIPATVVERIELIRGETAGLNLRGQNVVVNVVLSDSDTSALRVETRIRTTENTSTINPETKVSKSGRWGLTQYTFGVEGGEARSQQPRGPERYFLSGTLAELRDELENSDRSSYQGNFNTETQFSSGGVLRLNGRIGSDKSNTSENSHRLALTPATLSRDLLEIRNSDTEALELGGDYSFTLSPSIKSKLIALWNQADTTGLTALSASGFSGDFLSASTADRKTEEDEGILRSEWDISLANGRLVESNLEYTRNTLSNTLALFEDNGQGLEEVPLPGANTEVEESRWDAEINYAFNLGPFSIDTGVAYERSTITQQGDAENERSFSFLKPRMMVTYAPRPQRQTRLRLQREVAQLNFNDFVSATNFGDNQIDFGNPELSPENTWVSELTLEQRFGEIGAVNITAFHHWIEDVQDKLPLTGIFEIPGNIGNGRRWGLETEITLPLDSLSLPNMRLDIQGRYQSSSVTDPVTGNSRVLSDEGKYTFRANIRQTFQNGLYAWGGMVAIESEVPSFGLDEKVTTDDIDDTFDIDIYIETTRWFGLRTRLQFGNVLNRTFNRNRIVYEGRRELSPIKFQELRDRTRGHSIELSMTGVF